MKIRKRLTPEQAEKLGLEIKPNEKGRNTARYTVDVNSNSESNTNTYKKPVLSAWKDGRVLSVEEWCESHSIDPETIHSAKLVTHTGVPFYNVVFKDENEPNEQDLERLKKHIETELNGVSWFDLQTNSCRSKEAVLVLSDIHFGAYIDGLIKTPDYSISKVVEYFTSIVREVNQLKYKKVHVYILGDLIESFTGLNHKNSWKGLGKGMFGADVVKLCCEIIHKSLLNHIVNLGEIKIVGGNHDRVTSSKDEDTGSGAADLISWGLELIGYNVEFNSFIVSTHVDGICYILTHGHHPISKKPASDMVLKYGDQYCFNVILEGHLHTRIQMHSVTNLDKVSYDSITHRKVVCPSLFTGNSYSEELGYTTNAGYMIFENNGHGKPNMFDFSL